MDQLDLVLGDEERRRMLIASSRRRGFTLIEAMVVLTIVGVMLAYGIPAFSTWIANTRIRGTAESILSGLQYTKAEASSRNQQVRFQLVTDLTAACTRTTASPTWIVDLVDAANDSVEGRCDLAASDVSPTAPSILVKKPGRDGSGNTQVEASNGVTSVVFNGLGRVTPVPTDDIEYVITGPNGSSCREQGGDETCLRILVSAGGQIRMCSDSYPTGDPQRCP